MKVGLVMLTVLLATSIFFTCIKHHSPAAVTEESGKALGINKILYLNCSDAYEGVCHIYTINGDGTGEKCLTCNYEGSESWHSWTNDNRILFASTMPPGPGIFIMNADGSNLKFIGSRSFSSLFWHRGMNKIAYWGLPFDEKLYVMNEDNTGDVAASTDQAYRYLTGQAWSPDTRQIVFMVYNSQTQKHQIYTMNLDGTNYLKVSQDTNYNDLTPSWSPDGSKIAFVSQRGGTDTAVYIMNTDGSGVRKITSNSTNCQSPSWSPDGAKIAYYGARREGDGYIWIGLRVVGLDGAGENLLAYANSDYGIIWR